MPNYFLCFWQLANLPGGADLKRDFFDVSRKFMLLRVLGANWHSFLPAHWCEAALQQLVQN